MSRFLPAELWRELDRYVYDMRVREHKTVGYGQVLEALVNKTTEIAERLNNDRCGYGYLRRYVDIRDHRYNTWTLWWSIDIHQFMIARELSVYTLTTQTFIEKYPGYRTARDGVAFIIRELHYSRNLN